MVSLALVVVGASGLLVLAAVLIAMVGFAPRGLPRLGPWFLLDAALLAVLLFGLHRRNRIASVVLFAYVAASRVYLWISEPSYTAEPKVIMFDLVVIGAAFFGMVGVFKHHRGH